MVYESYLLISSDFSLIWASAVFCRKATSQGPKTTLKTRLSFSSPGLLISVPFLLATASVYLLITELRDTHGKALACHTLCLAMAFSCLAATQLAGHAFPTLACTIMGKCKDLIHLWSHIELWTQRRLLLLMH